MTAPMELRTPTEPVTLADRLTRLSDYVRRIADARWVDAAFARALLDHLGPIAAEASIQAAGADQAEIYRAQAADRERLRGVVQAVAAELDRLDAALASDRRSPEAESARFAVQRIRDLIGPAVAPVENLEES